MTARPQTTVTVRIDGASLSEDETNKLGRVLARQLEALNGVDDAVPATQRAPERYGVGLGITNWETGFDYQAIFGRAHRLYLRAAVSVA